MLPAARRPVLVIGLDPHRVPGRWDPAPVAAAIAAALDALVAGGFEPRACLLGLDGDEDVEGRVTEALLAQEWVCVVVGGGLRHVDEPTGLHDTVVALVERHAPRAAVAFPTSPHDIAAAVVRRLGPDAG